MNNLIYTTISILAFLLILDFTAFIAWAMSGQMPVDNFHFGVISKSVIGLFI